MKPNSFLPLEKKTLVLASHYVNLISLQFNSSLDLRETGQEEENQMAQGRDCWQAFVNTVMNLCVLVPQC
jgi:hypothetical protein